MNLRALETPRLVLEPLVAAHADALHPGLADERAYAYIDDDRFADAGALRARYRSLETRRSPDGTQQWLNWAVLRRSPQTYLGYVQATIDEPGHAIVGYLLFADHWRQGYGGEAVGALVTHLFADWSIALVEAFVDARNVASRALLAKLGFANADDERWFLAARAANASE